MKKAAQKLFALSLAILAVSGCALGEERLFPDLASSSKQNVNVKAIASSKMQSNLPVLGKTNFEPVTIATAQNTGTFVGQKVISIRNELVGLQNVIRKHNHELQGIRSSVMASSADYATSVSFVEGKLQAGTTPGNPYVVSALQKAQDSIKGMTGNAIVINQLSNRVSSDIVMVKYIINSIKSSYKVTGAVDEDHAQLKILQGEAEKTQVVLNNMLNELNNDYASQQQYIDDANKAIMSLEEPVMIGRFGMPYSQQDVGIMPAAVLTPAMKATPAKIISRAKTAEIQNQENFSSRPLLKVKFNKNNVDYKDGLNKAVNGALKTKPTMMFDIVAITPAKSSPALRNEARLRASEIFQEVVAIGVSPENVSLSAKSSADISISEVHIYVK